MTRNTLILSLALSALILVASLWWWFERAAGGQLSGFLRSADQQAQALFNQGDTAAAAKRFQDPQWRAAAAFRAADFKQAAAIYAGLSGADAAYNHANALVMLGNYSEAIQRYDDALALQPDWQAALQNREIARVRAKRVEQKGGEGTGGKLGADEIRFDSSPASSANPEQQELVETEQAGDAELRAAWLRRVQTNPGDFLRAKFAYQLSAKPAGDTPP